MSDYIDREELDLKIEPALRRIALLRNRIVTRRLRKQVGDLLASTLLDQSIEFDD